VAKILHVDAELIMRLAHRLLSSFDNAAVPGFFLFVAALAACGGGTGYRVGPIAGDGRYACPGQSGILSLAWTVSGSVPSTEACAGVDHLELTLAPDACQGVLIEPIPCALDRFRYDHLPEGPATVQLQSVGGTRRIGGSARVDLSPAVPAVPTPLDLR
jgi:hypothetical protein